MNPLGAVVLFLGRRGGATDSSTEPGALYKSSKCSATSPVSTSVLA